MKKNIHQQYWNIYPVYASDGDNWSEDNERAIKAVKNFVKYSNMFGYAELLPSTIQQQCIIDLIRKLTDKKFVSVIIKEKKDLWDALKIDVKERS